jgi:hypothetical protein
MCGAEQVRDDGGGQGKSGVAKGEASTDGRGKGREKSNRGEAAAETERLSNWAPAPGDWAATGCDFCSRRHWATERQWHRANGRYQGSGRLRERWGSDRQAFKTYREKYQQHFFLRTTADNIFINSGSQQEPLLIV